MAAISVSLSSGRNVRTDILFIIVLSQLHKSWKLNDLGGVNKYNPAKSTRNPEKQPIDKT